MGFALDYGHPAPGAVAALLLFLIKAFSWLWR